MNLTVDFSLGKSRREGEKATFPGMPYLMLHSLSHLLITAVSLDCGYAASSIRERIYAGASGFGILLYTGELRIRGDARRSRRRGKEHRAPLGTRA